MKKGRRIHVYLYERVNLEDIKGRQDITRIHYHHGVEPFPAFHLFQNLRRLNVSGAYCIDLRGLETLKHLRVLVCRSCCLRSLDGVPPSLVELHAEFNELENADALAYCRKLRVLCLMSNPLSVLPDLHGLRLLQEANCTHTHLPKELAVFCPRGKLDAIDAWRRATARHHWVRTWKRRAAVAVLGVAKRRRAIRDVLGLIARAVWEIK